MLRDRPDQLARWAASAPQDPLDLLEALERPVPLVSWEPQDPPEVRALRVKQAVKEYLEQLAQPDPAARWEIPALLGPPGLRALLDQLAASEE